MDAGYRGSTLSHDLPFSNRPLPSTYSYSPHEQSNPISQPGVIENAHAQIIPSSAYGTVSDATLRQFQLSRNDSTSLSQPSLYLVAEAPPDPPSQYSSSSSLAPQAAGPNSNVLLVTPPKAQSSHCSPGTLSTASVLQQMKQVSRYCIYFYFFNCRFILPRHKLPLCTKMDMCYRTYLFAIILGFDLLLPSSKFFVFCRKV